MKTVAVTIPISVGDFRANEKILTVKNTFYKLSKLSSNLLSKANFQRTNYNTSNPVAKFTRPKMSRRSVRNIGVIVAAVIFMVVLGKLINSREGAVQGDRVEVQGAKATQELKKEFSFPLLDSEGEEISQIVYRIDKAELKDEIIVQGSKAKAVNGRTFLILTIMIKNDYNQEIEINSRDYVRLSVNRNEENWLAADIHSDPVQVQAISTKPTRLGFPINDSDTNLVLQIGEIDSDKERIDLSLE